MCCLHPTSSCNGWNWPKLFVSRGRPGFDVGAESVQGMPSTSSLVKPLETKVTANDTSYALAA
jgi:hypothetical protein